MEDRWYYEGISKDPRQILKFIKQNCGKTIYCVDLEKEELRDDEVLFMLTDLCNKFNLLLRDK